MIKSKYIFAFAFYRSGAVGFFWPGCVCPKPTHQLQNIVYFFIQKTTYRIPNEPVKSAPVSISSSGIVIISRLLVVRAGTEDVLVLELLVAAEELDPTVVVTTAVELDVMVFVEVPHGSE